MKKTQDKADPGQLYHLKADETPYDGGGLRAFFSYRDTDMEGATSGQLRAIFVKANAAPENVTPGGTGDHYHFTRGEKPGFHAVLVTKGWLKFQYDGVETLVKEGDLVHQPMGLKNGNDMKPGLVHRLYDWSWPTRNGEPTGEPAAEYIEFTSPDFRTRQLGKSGRMINPAKPK